MSDPPVSQSDPSLLSHSQVEAGGPEPGGREPQAGSTKRTPVRHFAVHGYRADLFSAIRSFLPLVVIALFITTFLIQPSRIVSGSMERTLLIGDFLLIEKEPPDRPDALRFADPLPRADVHRGDIVVFRYPVDPSLHLVKRVVGMPGDRLKIRDGVVFVNERALPEPYTVYGPSQRDPFRDDFPHLSSTDPEVTSRWWTELHQLVENGELTVPRERYFVLGDNRNNSEDSRYWGLVPRAAIAGRPLLIYFSVRPGEGAGEPGRESGLRDADAASPRGDISNALFPSIRWKRILRVIR